MKETVYSILFVGSDLHTYLTDARNPISQPRKSRIVHIPELRKLWFYLIRERDMPDLMLIDIDRPDQQDLEIVQILKNHPRYRYIPIMVYTRSLSRHWRNLFLLAGADDVLFKPQKKITKTF